MNKVNTNIIFKKTTDRHNVVCPPEQVFVKSEFDFLLTIGGDLVKDEYEYEKFIERLKLNGETEFFILENIGATTTERNTPFQTTINLDDNYSKFQEKVGAFEPPFGWTIHHFFIYGQKDNWGIYICEYPTINIIGCTEELSDEFRQVFSIKNNGYDKLKEFLKKEYETKPELLNELIKNYRLEK